MTDLSKSFVEAVSKFPGLVQIKKRGFPFGLAYHIPFENGYTASLVQFIDTGDADDNKWQVAVLKDNNVKYDTDIGDHIIKMLDETAVLALCGDICRLTEDGKLPIGSVYSMLCDLRKERANG